ncbi:hypothetical protein ACFE04_026678 [Oxalis oulophora]
MASSHSTVIITVTIMILTVTLTQSKSQNNIIIKGNTTLSSDNHTFSLGFFTTNQPNHYYLGIWYSSLPTPTYVWVANRAIPTLNLLTSTLAITDTGQLSVLDGPVSVWKSEGVKTKLYNVSTGFTTRLLETGNLVVFSPDGFPVWESFDYPTDTWLPGMNITGDRRLVSWRSEVDPAPGLYSMRLKPYGYNEFELVYNSSDDAYWSTGNWTGTSFTNVPEMTIPYIYMFHFMNPAKPSASFWYTEMASDVDSTLPLTRFQVDVNGQLKQFTWSVQGSNWNMFWSQPEDKCKVYALCGNLGFCTNSLIKPCVCFHGYSPAKENEWDSDDYSSGCRRTSADLCESSDRFVDVGAVGFDASDSLSFSGSRSACEKSCLDNCSCIGLYHNDKANFCKVLYGSGLNLRNLTAYSINQDVLYLRVPKEQSRGTLPKPTSNTLLLVSVIVATISIFLIVSVALLLLRKRVKKRKGLEEDGIFPVLNLKRPPSAANIGGEEGGNGEKWFFPPWASRKIIEGNLSEIIDQRLAGAFDADEAERVALVAIWCIQDNEEMRPTMGMVVKMLEGMVEIGIPPAPKLLQALVSGESYHGVGTGGGCSGDDVTDMDLSRGGSHSSGNISPHWE